jgi:signal transduction histidine kinase/DNA-binding NarL/FixJ family response regulator
MTTLLVIAAPAVASAVQSALDAERYRLLQRSSCGEDELLLTASSIDGCIIDADLTSVEPLRAIRDVRRLMPHCPLILYATDSVGQWAEDAYLLGVDHILTKPLRPRLLNSVLERVLPNNGASGLPVPSSHGAVSRSERMPMSSPSSSSQTITGSRIERHGGGPVDQIPVRMLALLRNYSSILAHSLNAESLPKEFLLLLREIVGVNRAAIFLRPAPISPNDPSENTRGHKLHAACAIGLPGGLLEHFQLSLDGGIGGHLFRYGRIVRRDSEEAESDMQMRKEFQLLGAEVAIPILDRESLVGLAVFDGRVTGQGLSNEELHLIFHLLEQLGLSIKNIWLHDQVSENHEMMADILQQFSSGCVVVGRDLNVLHANEMARRCFPRPGRHAAAFDFADLPQIIGAKVFDLLRSGSSISPFRYQPSDQPEKHFQVTISAFRKLKNSVPTAALVIIEDVSQAVRLRRLEIETANLRLMQQMAERMAHEIGNAVVPISTHQQLLKERIDDPDFQKSLAGALQEGVRRVTRLVNQMRYLARDRTEFVEPVQVKQLIEEAFREARTYHPASTVLLHFDSKESLIVPCDRVGLKHAFAEILLNALQANTQSCQVQVRSKSEVDSTGARWVRIEVSDSGAGFTPEAADKVPKPFFTTRNVGLGLGLAVTDKIIQTHHGKLEIPPPQAGQPGVVRVTLPLDPVPDPDILERPKEARTN